MRKSQKLRIMLNIFLYDRKNNRVRNSTYDSTSLYLMSSTGITEDTGDALHPGLEDLGILEWFFSL